jgi:O-antigen/teichoic acid export membrane protein
MNFRRWVVFTFLIHALVVVVDKGGGLVLYLLTAEQRDQHGKAGIAASLPFILGAIANLGLATALVYFVRRGRYSAQVCFETALGVAMVWGTAVALLAGLTTLYVLPWLNPAWVFDPWGVIPVCAAVPFLLLASYANSTQLATERIRDYGLVHLVTAAAFLPAFFLCFYWFGGRLQDNHVPLGVAWGRLLSTALVAGLAVWLVRSVVQVRVRLHRDFLDEAIRYGWKANLTSTLTYLNHRLDLVVLGAVVLASTAAAGADKDTAERLAGTEVAFYSMAVTWAELVWHFPEAMRDLFFSKVAGSSHEQARLLTPVLSRLGLLLSLVGVLAIVLLIDPMMGAITWLAKGSTDTWYTDWSPMVSASLWWLVPGTAAFTVSKVLQADLAARDRLQTCVNAQLAVLVSMLALDLWLIPAHGAVGAAVASTAAYLIGTVWSLVAYAQQTGTAWWRCLVVHGSDFRYIRDIVSAVVGKLRRGRA